jgi:hypothetical protein
LYVSRGLVRLSELCFSGCFSSIGDEANAMAIDEATSIRVQYSTVVQSTGLGADTCRLETLEEAVIGNVNFSRNALAKNSTGCSGFSLQCSKRGSGFGVAFLWVEYAETYAFLHLEPGLASHISDSVFVHNKGNCFRVSRNLTVESSWFLDDALKRIGPTDTLTFARCFFAAPSEPHVIGCVFVHCQFGQKVPSLFPLLHTRFCDSQFRSVGGVSAAFIIFLMLLTLLVVLTAVYFLASLRYDVRPLMRYALAGLSVLTCLSVLPLAGPLFLFLLLPAAVIVGVIVFTRPDMVGEERALIVQGYVDRARSFLSSFTQRDTNVVVLDDAISPDDVVPIPHVDPEDVATFSDA